MNSLIEQQFSNTVALAENAIQLNYLAANLMGELRMYELPIPIFKTGLKFKHDGATLELDVCAHGLKIKGRFDHIWQTNDASQKSLSGRIRFFKTDSQGHDIGDSLYEIVFDYLGNARLGNEGMLMHSIVVGSETLQDSLRKIALDLINVIHSQLETIPRKN